MLGEGAGMNNLPTGSLTSWGRLPSFRKWILTISVFLFINLHRRKTKGIADRTEQYFTSEQQAEVVLSDFILREIKLIDCPSNIDCILFLAKYVLLRSMSSLSR
jgi:hypothetical protein